MKVKSIAVLGIHTGIGKTIASAVIAEAMGFDYWKPVQAGIEERDVITVEQLVTNGALRVHKEAVLLSQPMSPHAAAAAEGVAIDFKSFNWPKTDKTILVETAGGVLSPISASATMADFVSHYKMPSILVTKNYLGSINHTLMSIEVIKARGIDLMGVIVCGDSNKESEDFIEQYGCVSIIGRVPEFPIISHSAIIRCASGLKPLLAASGLS